MDSMKSETNIDIFSGELREALAAQHKKIEEMEQRRKYDITLLNETNARTYTSEAKMRYHLLHLKESAKEFSHWIIIFIIFHLIEIFFIFCIISK